MPVDPHRSDIDVDAGDGLTLHVASSGAGRPLVLLHGFTGSGRSWDALRQALDRARRVITVDLPGHGMTAAPPDPARYALPRFSDDLARVLDALQLDRIALLGYSLGGRAALRFALAHPHRVTAIVLESCSPGIADAEERARRMHTDAALADSIARDGMTAFVDQWERLPLWSTQAALPDAVRAHQRAVRLAGTTAGLAASLRGASVAAEPDVTSELQRLATPALVVAGALDVKFARMAAGMASVLPRAQLAVVEKAGHAVHLERPTHFASLVGRFLDSFDC